MKGLLPYENIEYTTKLSKEEVLSKLAWSIEKQKKFGLGAFTDYSKPYIGFIWGNRFEIKRDISYRNSFLPLIQGDIIEDIRGVRIRVVMKPHSFVIAFMIVWFGGVSVACIAAIVAALSGNFNPALLVPFGMLLFGIVLIMVGFKTESRRSKKDLCKIMEAEIV